VLGVDLPFKIMAAGRNEESLSVGAIQMRHGYRSGRPHAPATEVIDREDRLETIVHDGR
jgi:hypothetical protein